MNTFNYWKLTEYFSDNKLLLNVKFERYVI